MAFVVYTSVEAMLSPPLVFESSVQLSVGPLINFLACSSYCKTLVTVSPDPVPDKTSSFLSSYNFFVAGFVAKYCIAALILLADNSLLYCTVAGAEQLESIVIVIVDSGVTFTKAFAIKSHNS